MAAYGPAMRTQADLWWANGTAITTTVNAQPTLHHHHCFSNLFPFPVLYWFLLFPSKNELFSNMKVKKQT